MLSWAAPGFKGLGLSLSSNTFRTALAASVALLMLGAMRGPSCRIVGQISAALCVFPGLTRVPEASWS